MSSSGAHGASSASGVAIRPVRPEDVPAVVAMVHELALYERAPEQCHLSEAVMIYLWEHRARPTPREIVVTILG